MDKYDLLAWGFVVCILVASLYDVLIMGRQDVCLHMNMTTDFLGRCI